MKCYFCSCKTVNEYQLLYRGDEHGNPVREPMCSRHSEIFSGDMVGKSDANIVERLIELSDEAAGCIHDCHLTEEETSEYLGGMFAEMMAEFEND